VKAIVSLYREALQVLPPGTRGYVVLYASLLAALAVLDVAALGLLALVIGPLSTGTTVRLPLVGELDDIGVVWAFAAICLLMVIKSVLAVGLTWWATRRTSRYEVQLWDRLFVGYLRAPWQDRLRKNSAHILRVSDTGVDASLNGFVIPGATLLGEIVNLTLIILTLAIVQPVLALVTLVFVGLLGVALFFGIARHTRTAADAVVGTAIQSTQFTIEAVGAMKEVALRSKEREVSDVLKVLRTRNARARANLNFLGIIPRYALESGLIGGFVVVGGAGYLLGGIQQAVAGVALFALAGFRIAPAAVRIQAVFSQMIASAPYPRLVIDELHDVESSAAAVIGHSELPFPPAPKTVRFDAVTFRYDGARKDAVKGVSLDIPLGSFVAFVGESGAGKSTMVDLVLGLLEPTNGAITVDRASLAGFRDEWRRRVGYVPQDVAIFDATIGQNVALSWSDEYDRDQAQLALRRAQLWDFVDAREGGLDSHVGERGIALSGGQRQRLGIARALYSDPLVLVMDEATSALDGQTEAQVAGAIAALGPGVTRIVVAHRLATIRDADRVFLMRDGRVVDSGTFDDLVAADPEFAAQARLAGLA
jgi:ABC-type multidrug transport system fused ATPase/permease subunit